MLYIGMVFQYNEAEGTGWIMLSDGEKKAFSRADWIDQDHEPKVGQKISCEAGQEHIQVKVATEADQLKASEDKQLVSAPKKVEPDVTVPALASVDAYKQYFIQKGFKLVKDVMEGSVQTLSLRKYVEGEFSEVHIISDNATIDVTLMVDGKKVATN